MAGKSKAEEQPNPADFNFPMSRGQRFESVDPTKRFPVLIAQRPSVTDRTARNLMTDLQKNLAALGPASEWLNEPYTPPSLDSLLKQFPPLAKG